MAKMHLVPIRRGYWGSATASERKLRRAALKTNARHSPIDSTQQEQWAAAHDPHEALRDLWQRERPSYPGAARYRSCRRSGL